MTMSDGQSSITFAGPAAAPAIGASPRGTPESADHGSGDTIVVSIGAWVASQESDAGVDQTMQARVHLGNCESNNRERR